MVNIDQAQADVKELYDNLEEVALKIVTSKSEPLDKLVKKLQVGIEVMGNEELRTYMAMISIESYNLSMCREQSALKDACAATLYKEGLAKSFNSASGTVDAKKNEAAIDNLDKQVVSMLYSAVSDLFKAKTDEAHRIVSTISNILISRSADAKLQYNPRSEEVDTEIVF